MRVAVPSVHVHTVQNQLHITIDRPEALNAINREVMGALHDVFADLVNQSKIRGVIITGSGQKAFAAGADIKEFSFEGDASRTISAFGHETYQLITDSRIPVIAVINGFALGGGLELAMACHIRIAETHAQFGMPEIKLGLVPGYGGTQRLPALVGKAKALEWLLTADLVDAKEAHRTGLVSHLAASGEGMEAAIALLGRMEKRAPLAAQHILNLVKQMDDTSIDGFEAEIDAFAESFKTADAKEGIAAFLEKRKAVFKGQ